MLTTDTVTPRSAGLHAGPGPLVAAALATTGVGAVLVVVGAVVSGAAASYGALFGTALAVVVLAFGAFAVDAVARLMPAASLLFAMVTYVFQVVLMALVFAAVNEAGLLDDTLDRAWLGGATIAGALVWSAVQLRAATTARIPVFDTPAEQASEAPAEGARPAAEGGAR